MALQTPIRILTVDDDPNVLRSIESFLSVRGYTVLGASGGRQAVQILETEEIDVLITDMMMPDLDGTEVIRKAREHPANPAVIVITGQSAGPLLTDPALEGAFTILPKPLDIGKLKDAISQIERLRQPSGSPLRQSDTQRDPSRPTLPGPARIFSLATAGFRPGVGRIRTRMVGRRDDLDRLRAASDRWFAGEGQVVCISGEAGIGKSRLVLELKQALRDTQDGDGSRAFGAHSPDYRMLEGCCLPTGVQQIQYWVFLEVLRGCFGLSGEDDLQESLAKVTASVEDLFGNRTTVVLPFLQDLLSLRLAEGDQAGIEALGPEELSRRMEGVLLELVERLAQDKPLVLVLEDLHWVDELSLQALGQLMDALQSLPLLLVCVYRPFAEKTTAEPADLARQGCPDRSVEIRLKPLSSSETTEFIGALAPQLRLPRSERDLILNRTLGNPFYVEEAVCGILERSQAAYHLEPTPGSRIDVPLTVQEAVASRVNRLQPRARALLQGASVIGHVFDHRLLQHLAEDEPDLDRHLRELNRQGLVFQEQTGGHTVFRFKHAYTREATYQNIQENERRTYHRKVAEGIEQLYHDRVQAFSEELAYHYSRSDSTDKSLEYFYKAGEKAKSRSAYESAIGHFREGLEVVATLPEGEIRDRQELQFQAALGSALIPVRGFGSEETGKVFQKAEALLGQVKDQPEVYRVLWGLWVNALGRRELQTAHEIATKVLDTGCRLDAPGVIVHGHHAVGHALFVTGRGAQSVSHFKRGIALYNPGRDRDLAYQFGSEDPGVGCHGHLSETLTWLGYLDQGLQRGLEGLALAREIDHPFSTGFALHRLGMVHRWRRENIDKRAHHQEQIDIAAQYDIKKWHPRIAVEGGWLLAEQGRYQEAIRSIKGGIELWVTKGITLYQAESLGVLAEAYLKAGLLDEGLDAISRAIALVEGSDERYWYAELLRLRGELLIEREPADVEGKAEACFTRALQVAGDQGAKLFELRAAVSLTRLLRNRRQLEDARQVLEPVYGWFTEGLDTADLTEARELLRNLGGRA